MKVWKLISGILSMVLFLVVAFQSCAAGVANTLAENGEVSGSAGILVAILMLAGGIVCCNKKIREKWWKYCIDRSVWSGCIVRIC